MDEPQEPEPDITSDEWDVLRRCQFVRRVFAPYPSVQSVEPQAWDDDRDESGYHVAAPYTGQAFDPDKFELIEEGWDHEHCWVCWAKITAGDEYWANDGPDQVELCPACFGRVRGQLPGADPT